MSAVAAKETRKTCYSTSEGLLAMRSSGWAARQPSKNTQGSAGISSVPGQAHRRSAPDPQRGGEIAKTMAGVGCTARLPSAHAGVPPRFRAQSRKRASRSAQSYFKATGHA